MLAATVLRKTFAFGKVFLPGSTIPPDRVAKMPLRNRSALVDLGKIQLIDVPDEGAKTTTRRN